MWFLKYPAHLDKKNYVPFSSLKKNMRQKYKSFVSVNWLLQGSGHTYLKQKIKAIKLKQILHSLSVVLQNAKKATDSKLMLWNNLKKL